MTAILFGGSEPLVQYLGILILCEEVLKLVQGFRIEFKVFYQLRASGTGGDAI